MPHKKSRGGQKKTRARELGSVRYPHRKVRCTAGVAPNCMGWMNENTMPAPGICKRCMQALESKK